MRRFALIALIALLVWVPVANPVSAGKGWCRSDPIVSLNGVELQIWVAIPLEDQSNATGPINIAFGAPRASKLTVVYTDAGFNNYGESIFLAPNSSKIAADGSFTIKVMISVPMRGNQFVPMQVEIVPSSGESIFVEGQTVGVAMALTLKGETVADVLAHNGTVIPAVPSLPSGTQLLPTATATSAPTDVATATATPSPTEVATEIPTETAATETPTDEATVAATETVDPTDVVVDQTEIVPTEEATASSEETPVANDGNVSGSENIVVVETPTDIAPEATGEPSAEDTTVTATPVGTDEPAVSESDEGVATGIAGDESKSGNETSGESAGDGNTTDGEETGADNSTSGSSEEAGNGTQSDEVSDGNATDDSASTAEPTEESTTAGDDAVSSTAESESSEPASDVTPEATVEPISEDAASDVATPTPGSDEAENVSNGDDGSGDEVVEEVPTVEPIATEGPDIPSDDVATDDRESDESDDDKTPTPTPTATPSPTVTPSQSAVPSETSDDKDN